MWGTDTLFSIDDLNDHIIKDSDFRFFDKFDNTISRYLFNGFSSLSREYTVFINSFKTPNIYSVSGPCSISLLLRNINFFAWVFRRPTSYQSILSPFHPNNLKRHTGFLCLTKNAEKYFSNFAPSKFIPWCVDLDLFDGEPAFSTPKVPFFLASGKTGRDYKTLVESSYYTKAEIRIIGPSSERPKDLPSNVKWIDTSSNPPDQAIDYQTLREWYAQCIAVCIPLSGDADDTCGYTNMLEAMAMRKPVLMTKSGCLHINPETDEFGIQIKSRDAQGWAHAMNHLHQDHEKAMKIGQRGRLIVERDFTIDRFNQDVLDFIQTNLKKVERKE